MSFTEWFTDSLDSVGEIGNSVVDNIGSIYTSLDSFVGSTAEHTVQQPQTVEQAGVQVPVQEAGGVLSASGGLSTNTVLVAVGSLGGLLLTLKAFKVI